jgi:2-iminoacetate synthase ThiH
MYICVTKPNNMTTINSNTTITAKSICDSDCIFTAYVVERKGDYVRLQMDGKTFSKKVKKSFDGSEYVLALGSYSMAPAFK